MSLQCFRVNESPSIEKVSLKVEFKTSENQENALRLQTVTMKILNLSCDQQLHSSVSQSFGWPQYLPLEAEILHGGVRLCL